MSTVITHPEAYRQYNFDSVILSPTDGMTGFVVANRKWQKAVFVQKVGWVLLADENSARAKSPKSHDDSS